MVGVCLFKRCCLFWQSKENNAVSLPIGALTNRHLNFWILWIVTVGIASIIYLHFITIELIRWFPIASLTKVIKSTKTSKINHHCALPSSRKRPSWLRNFCSLVKSERNLSLTFMSWITSYKKECISQNSSKTSGSNQQAQYTTKSFQNTMWFQRR